MTSDAAPGHGPLVALRRAYLRRRSAWRRTPVGEVVVRSVDLSLVSRATVLSTQQVACLAPLAVGILAMLHPTSRGNLGRELARLFGLDQEAARSVTSLFTSTQTIATATGVIGLLLLVGWAAGVPGYQQRIVADIWDVPTSGFGQLVAARIAWLGAFAGLTILFGFSIMLSRHLRLHSIVVLIVWCVGAFLTQWLTHYLLLGRAVSLRRLALGGVIAIALEALTLMAINQWGSAIINEAVEQFGLIGITFLVQATAVVFASALVTGELIGAEIDRQRHPDRWPGEASAEPVNDTTTG